MTTSMRTVTLPEDLCSAAERLYSSSFANLEELIAFLLKEITGVDSVRVDEEEERIVQERLKELGYL